MPVSNNYSLALVHCLRTIHKVLLDLCWFVLLFSRPRVAVAAENLFLRERLALFQERKLKPHRATDSTRWLMAVLSRLFDWRTALVVVKPDTFIRRRREGSGLFWRWKSKPVGRPRLPKDLQELIRMMAVENPTWGEERITNELKLELGIWVSPRSVHKYLTAGGPSRKPHPQQRWLPFICNHAKAIVACDFFVVVTATFRVLCVFVLMEVGTSRIVHQNVTADPTTEWTLQQFRDALPGEHTYRFVINDRDWVYSKHLEKAVADMGFRILRTPVRTPKANSVCERNGRW